MADHPECKPSFSKRLLAWYRAGRRPLPWRVAGVDPYAVWVSEIMAQQTTIAAMLPYFERWMAAFPTIQSLASADLHDVLRHWSGLGYYARARNLKRAAETVAREYGGKLPASVEALMKLPGIGRYTAGAIASVAFGLPEPILDTNVIRVLSRLHAIEEDIDLPLTRRKLWRLAADGIPSDSPGDYNQALMELGALVCLPDGPACHRCPVCEDCAARRQGEAALYPRMQRKPRWVSITDCAAAIERDGRLLFIRRPEHGLWGGLWELPRVTAEPGEDHAWCALRAASEAAGLAVEIGEQFAVVRHTVMNRKIELRGYRAAPAGETVEARPEPERAVDYAWLTGEAALESLALSSPQRILLGKWLAAGSQPSLALA